jgi:hypothetical protein
MLENCSFCANIYLNIRPIKQDKETLNWEFSFPLSKNQVCVFPLFMMII